ncbi:MAG: peptidylprolyl isomerase [Pseudomonadota bacterium]
MALIGRTRRPTAGTARAGVKLALLASGFALASCSSIENPLSSAATPAPAPLTADQPVTQGVPEVRTIKRSGGAKIAVLVNKQPVTTSAIRRRVAFVRLRRLKGNASAIARRELIDEAIKMQEAKRLRAVASDADVNRAFANFARRNKLSVKQMSTVLSRRGVSVREFKEFIRAQVSWQRVVGVRLQGAAPRASAKSRKRNHQPWLTAAGADVREEKEFTILQVIFNVPPKSRKRLLAARKREAQAFRQRFTDCGSARGQAAKLREVAVRDQGRVRAAQLPLRWRRDVKATPVGKTTSPKETERGVELLAVCRTRSIKTDTPDPTKVFESKNLQQAAGSESKRYFEELKKKAVIERRA